jgi:hypothetical protein
MADEKTTMDKAKQGAVALALIATGYLGGELGDKTVIEEKIIEKEVQQVMTWQEHKALIEVVNLEIQASGKPIEVDGKSLYNLLDSAYNRIEENKQKGISVDTGSIPETTYNAIKEALINKELSARATPEKK